MLPFGSVSKYLLFAHLVAAVCAIGASIHLFLRVVSDFRNGRDRASLLRNHGRTLGIACAVVFLSGALLYPAFRVRVRFDYLDAAMPITVPLFEIKEHLAALAALPVLGIAWMSRSLADYAPPGGVWRMFFVSLLVFVILTLSFNAWCGWYLVTLRSLKKCANTTLTCLFSASPSSYSPASTGGIRPGRVTTPSKASGAWTG